MSLGGKLTKMAGLPEITAEQVEEWAGLGVRAIEALERMAAALERANDIATPRTLEFNEINFAP